MPAALPAAPEKLTSNNVTALLQPLHPGAEVVSVLVTEHARCGDGVASTADRVSLKLGFSQNCGVPENVVLKTIFLHRFLRFGLPAILFLSRVLKAFDSLPLIGRFVRPLVFSVINVYQQYFPHAPEAMYANECNFYRSTCFVFSTKLLQIDSLSEGDSVWSGTVRVYPVIVLTHL